MTDRDFYLLGLLAVVGAVSYALRAAPFALFGSRRTPPPLVSYLGRVLAPAVIAVLVVYCFAGYVKAGCLASPLHGAAELLAGAVTVGVHLWRRNPLLSIALGTALYMALVR